MEIASSPVKNLGGRRFKRLAQFYLRVEIARNSLSVNPFKRSVLAPIMEELWTPSVSSDSSLASLKI